MKLPTIPWPRPAAVALACALFFCAVALHHGLKATRGLDWHPGSDAYRDIALAQIILDGDYPADYLVPGAWLWYNPLTGALIAGVSRATGLAPPQANVRMAPWINLLPPLLFFALAWRVAGPGAALAALLSFLFFLPQERPSYVSASYSPWLLAPHLAQALFYGSLLVWMRHLRRPLARTALLAGLLLGLTFLGHTAPAVLLGCVMVLTSALAEADRARHLRLLALALAAAFVASLPFTVSILFRYRLQIENPTPTTWIWEGAALGRLPETLWGLLHWQTALMLAGAVTLWRSKAPRAVKQVLIAWPAVSGAFLAYSYVAQWAESHGITLRQMNPGYHYVLYLIAAGHLYTGLGIVGIARASATALSNRAHIPDQDILHARLRQGILLAAITVLFAAHYRDFRVWHGFTRDRSVALRRLEQTDHFAPYQWIVANGRRNAIFLCNDRPGIYCVAPAGARMVSCDPFFWNLYVPWEPGAAAREQLWTALREGDADAFHDLAAAWGVTHILAEAEQRDWITEEGIPGLDRVFASENFTIHRVRQPLAQLPHDAIAD